MSTENDWKANLLKLREVTGAGMSDCRRALKEAQGDIKEAQNLIRCWGLDIAKKKSAREAKEGIIYSYVHSGRIGVLVEVNCETDFVARNEIFQGFAQNIAMQIAASHPLYISSDEIPDQDLEKEKANFENDLKGKPEAVRRKILEGKLAKRFEEVCLLNQKYIRDDSRTVRDYLSETIARLGENVVIRRFVRFELGGAN